MKWLVVVNGVVNGLVLGFGCTVGGTSYDETVQSAGSGIDGGSDAPFLDARGSDAAFLDSGSGLDAGTGSDGGTSGDAGLDGSPTDHDASVSDGGASIDGGGPGIEDDGRRLQTTFYACSAGSAGTGAVVTVFVVLGLALVRRRRVTAT